MPKRIPFGKEMRKEFLLDDDYLNLNNASFGTVPKIVLEQQRKYQALAEARPDEFIRYDYPKLLDEARAEIANYLHAPVDTIVYTPNTTTAINVVLRNIEWKEGDKIIFFSTIYGSCEKSIAYITETTPAESVKIGYTSPVSDSFFVDALKETVRKEREAGFNPRLCLFDTISSLPGCRIPFEALTAACKELGLFSLIDGAHGAGHIPLNLGKLDADFFVSNCHKWLFVPRGCAVFYVPLRNQALMRSTLPTSHGFVPKTKQGVTIVNPLPVDPSKSAYVMNFEFVGTTDTSPYLCVPAAIKWRQEVCGGEEEITRYCKELNKKASARLAELWGTEVMENNEGTLRECFVSNVKVPLDLEHVKSVYKKNGKEFSGIGDGIVVRDWITFRLMKRHGIFMAFMFYNNDWWVRLSAQVYLDLADFEWAAEKVTEVCEEIRAGKALAVEAKI